MKYDLGKRVIAFIIDSILVGMLGSFLSAGYNVTFQVTMPFWDNFVPKTEDWWQVIVFMGYFVLFAILKEGRTIGKMALNLEIVTDDNGPLDKNHLVLREVVKSLLMPISFISFIIAVFREDDKSIHDLLFESNVVVQETSDVETEPVITEKRDRDDDFYD